MSAGTSDSKIVVSLLFKLLPIQVLLASIQALNGFISGIFASNAIGETAMRAVGLYAPVNMLIVVVTTTMSGGALYLAGQFFGKNRIEGARRIFSTDLFIASVFALAATGLLLLLSAFDLTGFLTGTPEVRAQLNSYIAGTAAGVYPFVVGSQLSAFLSLENQTRRVLASCLAFVFLNAALCFLFVPVLNMGPLGLALASSIGQWVFLLIQAVYYLAGKSALRFSFRLVGRKDAETILVEGIPNSLSKGYQVIRGFAINALILSFVGGIGVSAFASVNSFLGIVWSLPIGMLAVSEMLISISVGEQDRRTLTEVMRNCLIRYVPLMAAVSLVVILCADPLTRLYFRDPTQPIYAMTRRGFRIMPVCMPLSVICMHFISYSRASRNPVMVHLLSALDGVILVVAFTAILMPLIGMDGVYIANVLNGIGTTAVIVLRPLIRKKRLPRTVQDLMMLPEDFGAAADECMDLSVGSTAEAVEASGKIIEFCREQGLDGKTANAAGLCLEEMAVNVFEHGNAKGARDCTVDVRVVHKDGELTLALKDGCPRFNPAEMAQMLDPADGVKGLGIRLLYGMADLVEYRNILGLNALTITLGQKGAHRRRWRRGAQGLEVLTVKAGAPGREASSAKPGASLPKGKGNL